MTTQITAPQKGPKHPSEGIWYEFSFAKVFKRGDEVVLQGSTVTITPDVVGLTFDEGNIVIEEKSVFVYVTGGAAGTTYRPLCEVDSTVDGLAVYEHRAQRGTIIVSED